MHMSLMVEHQMRVATKIELSKDELRKLVRSKQTSVRLSQRAHIVLLAADCPRRMNLELGCRL
jgi:hypothetical protein